jgi:hypothetical protein
MTTTEKTLLDKFESIAKNTRTTGLTAKVRDCVKKAIDNKMSIVEVVVKDESESESIHIQSVYNILKGLNLDYRKNDILRYTRSSDKHNHILSFIVKLA